MPRLPGVSQQQAVRALERAGWRIRNQGKHITMSRGGRVIAIPRHNPVDSITMGSIVKAAGLTIDEFKELL